MIFVFIEDGRLDFIEDVAEARQRYKVSDVESRVFQFYDDSGSYLRPRRSGSGTFELVPGPDADEDPIWLALFEASAINPNPWFKTIEEAKTHLRSKSAVVDRPPSDA